MSEKKTHMNLVIIGHIDHGKSTLMGHLLILTGGITDREMRQLESESKKLERASWKYAFVFDRLKEERERGITIDLAFRKFETKNFYFTLIDAPGHRDFVKNMITGSSQADATILVVSAKKGEFEAGISAGGQTIEHAYLARTLGVGQVAVAINKMDDATVNWSEDRFNEVKDEISRLLFEEIRFKKENVQFVPTSAWTGDNLNKKSDNLPWYKGPTLVEALDKLTIPPKPTDKDLRLPIQDVYKISGVGTVPVGRVETGILKTGDKVIIMPPELTTEIRSIEMHHENIKEAIPGDNIGFNIRGVAAKELRRGMVLGHANKTPPTVVSEFTGQIVVIYHPTVLPKGYAPVIHAHTAQVACIFEDIMTKTDPRTGQVVEENPDFLKMGEGGLVKLKPKKPLCLEKFSEYPQLGRFAIRDMGRTIAVGVVTDLKKRTK